MIARCVMSLCAGILAALSVTGPAHAEDCSNEPALRSKPGGSPTEITFRNASDMQRRIYWIDENGQRQLKAIVEGRKTDRQPTSATHVWVVTGPREKCLYVIAASSAPLIVEIGGSGGQPVFVAPPSMSSEPVKREKCSRHQIYDRRRGECVSKSSRCTRQQVYSSSLAECIPKSATCEKYQVYSSSLAKCIPKSNKPACQYKVDGAGNCVSPLFKACQKSYAACIKACGGKSSCTSGCHNKYQSKCGN